MIPRITHSRSRLVAHLNEYEDGAKSFFVSADTYPELLTRALAEVVQKAPHGWRRKRMAYLWFPPGALDDNDMERLEDWRERFAQYVLLGLNPNIEEHFSDELDFCMALDYNIDPDADRRTIYGEAEYQLKYKESRQHLKVLKDGLIEALADLPIPAAARAGLLVSYIPAVAGGAAPLASSPNESPKRVNAICSTPC